MSFVKILITKDIFDTALARALNLPKYKLNFKQHLQAADGELQAKLEGAIGEVVVGKWLQANQIGYKDDRENHRHDYALGNGFSLEIKTKVRTVTPRPDYACSIPAYTINMQTANLYAFVSLTQIKGMGLAPEKYSEAHIVGLISKEAFKKAAKYWEEGQIDPANGYPVKMNCYNVLINQMTKPSDFPTLYRDYITGR